MQEFFVVFFVAIWGSVTGFFWRLVYSRNVFALLIQWLCCLDIEVLPRRSGAHGACVIAFLVFLVVPEVKTSNLQLR